MTHTTAPIAGSLCWLVRRRTSELDYKFKFSTERVVSREGIEPSTRRLRAASAKRKQAKS